MRFSRNRTFLPEIVRGMRMGDPHEVEEIGDGVLALRWSAEMSFSIFFDTGRWKLTIAIKDAYKGAIFPEHLPRTGFLMGTFFKGGITTSERALLIVQQKLAPTASHYRLAADRQDRRDPFPFGDAFGDLFGEPKKK